MRAHPLHDIPVPALCRFLFIVATHQSFFFFLPTSDEPKKKRVKFLVETECFPGVHMPKKQSSGTLSTKAIAYNWSSVRYPRDNNSSLCHRACSHQSV